MLVSVGGSQVNNNSRLSSYLCVMEEEVCKLINVNNENHTIVSSVLKDAFSIVNYPQLTELDINFSIPFSFPYEVNASNNEENRIVNKLLNITDYVNSVYNRGLAKIYNSPAKTDYLCNPRSVIFCDKEYNLNHNADRCCKSIGSYIIYPSPSKIAPTTVASDIVGSTVLTIVLVVLLPLTLIIFSVLGYRAYKSIKSHNPQALPESVNIPNPQEEMEDLV
ncbi:hypothetical protein [Candidatus Ichthyocystis sparus]|uniref:hypothetical protein n=1 Tax=Candidatus Ichthyocystis sparus TaxID=1561004 RepID=UPI000B89D20C|nr:hypothetical protein [Candidatus Ichthyocystis sparus]